MNRKVVWDGTFHGRFEDQQYAIEVYNKHVEEVKRVIPREQLLLFDVASGWEPLCQFLGDPVPEVPFPRLNDTASFRRATRILETGLYVFWGISIAAVATGMGYCWPWISQHWQS